MFFFNKKHQNEVVVFFCKSDVNTRIRHHFSFSLKKQWKDRNIKKRKVTLCLMSDFIFLYEFKMKGVILTGGMSRQQGTGALHNLMV